MSGNDDDSSDEEIVLEDEIDCFPRIDHPATPPEWHKNDEKNCVFFVLRRRSGGIPVTCEGFEPLIFEIAVKMFNIDPDNLPIPICRDLVDAIQSMTEMQDQGDREGDYERFKKPGGGKHLTTQDLCAVLTECPRPIKTSIFRWIEGAWRAFSLDCQTDEQRQMQIANVCKNIRQTCPGLSSTLLRDARRTERRRSI